jgi:hypothetical protein
MLLEEVSSRECPAPAPALRLPDPACCRDLEREVSTDGLCL